MAVIVGVVSSDIHWCAGMHPPRDLVPLLQCGGGRARRWERDSKKVGLKPRVLKVEVGGLG